MCETFVIIKKNFIAQSYRDKYKCIYRKLLLLVHAACVDKTMWDKHGGFDFCLLLFAKRVFPVIPGREPGFLFEKDAEGADTFKTHAAANFGNREITLR